MPLSLFKGCGCLRMCQLLQNMLWTLATILIGQMPKSLMPAPSSNSNVQVKYVQGLHSFICGRWSIFCVKKKFQASLFMEKLIPGGNQFWGVVFSSENFVPGDQNSRDSCHPSFLGLVLQGQTSSGLTGSKTCIQLRGTQGIRS